MEVGGPDASQVAKRIPLIMSYEYEYPRPAVSVDMVVLRKVERGTEILLIQRKHDPFQGDWALPGGFVDMNETLEQAAERELAEETGLTARSVSQLGAFSEVGRDPRTRVISIAFRVLVDEDATAVAADDAAEVAWFPVNDLPGLAFDHDAIIELAVSRSRDVFIQ